MVRLLNVFLIFYSFFYLSLFVTDYSFLFSGIPNITGPSIGLASLILFRYFLRRQSFSASPLMNIAGKASKVKDKRLLMTAIAGTFTVFSVLSIARHLSLSSGSGDLGIFDQAIWNTTQGNILFSSLKGNINLLGDHFEPILLCIAPLYWLWPNVSILLILQSLLLASSIIPLYLIAKEKLKPRLLTYAFIVSFLLSRPLRGVGLSDFHPECFILPLLFWAYYFLDKKQIVLFFSALFLLLLCKEDTVFLISSFGIFICFAQKRFKLGIGLFIFGIAAWIMLTKLIIPSFHPLHKYDYMSRLPFGPTYRDNLVALLKNPLLLANFLGDSEKIAYCVKLFGPLVFLSFFSLPHYILFSVPLLKNIFVHPQFNGLYYINSHYTASVIPFVYIAAIYGAGQLIKKFPYRKTTIILSSLIVFSSLMFYSRTDASKFSRFILSIKKNNTLQRLSYLKRVPRDVSVATNFNLVPHLSHRKYIFEWHPDTPTSYIAEYIVVDKDLLDYLRKDESAKVDASLADIANKGYKLVFSNQQSTFFIFQYPDIDKALVEKVNQKDD